LQKVGVIRLRVNREAVALGCGSHQFVIDRGVARVPGSHGDTFSPRKPDVVARLRLHAAQNVGFCAGQRDDDGALRLDMKIQLLPAIAGESFTVVGQIGGAGLDHQRERAGAFCRVSAGAQADSALGWIGPIDHRTARSIGDAAESVRQIAQEQQSSADQPALCISCAGARRRPAVRAFERAPGASLQDMAV
jgi:hypothetical protein